MKITITDLPTGTSSATVCAGNDSRLSDSRTPTAHAASHASGGTDPVTLAESQVTNLTTDLAAKAPLASPTFTGTPAAPTASAHTNTTQLATTAFVVAEVAGAGKTLFTHFSDVGNSTTTETDLVSDTIAAAQLATNGDRLEGDYGGVFVSSGTASRQVRAYFGGTLVFDTGALTLSSSAAWTLWLTVIRVSASVARVVTTFTTEGAALAAYTSYTEVTGLTLGNTQVMKVTGQAAGVGAATNDIVAKMGAVSYKPA